MAELSSTASIESALEQAILSTRSDRRQPPADGYASFWMSSLGRCPRYQLAQRAGLPPTIPMNRRVQFKLWTGEYLGKGIQNLLELQGFLDPAWREKPVSYRSYSGKVDGLTHRINGQAIVELKTVDDNAVTRHGDLPEHYLWQGFGYCLAANIPTLVIFLIGKNQGLAKHQVFHLTEDWRKRLEQEITKMEDLWVIWQGTKTLIQCSHRFKWEDRWCPHQENPNAVNKEDYDAH